MIRHLQFSPWTNQLSRRTQLLVVTGVTAITIGLVVPWAAGGSLATFVGDQSTVGGCSTVGGQSGVGGQSTVGGRSGVGCNRRPRVDSVTPDSAVLHRKAVLVSISGAGFWSGSTVAFGPVASPTVTVDSSTQITAKVPPGSGTVDVTVSGPTGTSPVRKKDHFTYLAPPIITAIVPSSACATGGHPVRLEGSDFLQLKSIRFGGKQVTTFSTSASGTVLHVTAPPRRPGSGKVTVTNAAGRSAVSTTTFTWKKCR